MAPSPHLFLAVVVIAASASAAPGSAAAAPNMTEAEALVQLKKSFTNSSSLSSWLITNNDIEKQSPCASGSHEWHGVVCRRGVVSGLRLSALELSGTIDVDALAAFHHLRSVSFARNNFSGPLPAFYQLTALKSMYLSNNHFNGSIPDDFFANLSHLKKLWLNGNNLSGSIPASIAKATSLLELHLDNNDLTGQLPPQPPPALRSFNVSGNDLDGVVPEAFRKFDAGRFEGNAYLCYVPTDAKPCVREPHGNSTARLVAMVLATVLVSALVLAVTLRLWAGRAAQSTRPRNGGSDGKKRPDADEKPPVYMAHQESSVPHQKRSGSVSWITKRAGSSIGLGFGHRRGASSAANDLGGGSSAGGDLVIVNECKGVFRLADLMKAAAEVIGSGGLGSAYKAVMANGVAVVVKRARDMNRVAAKDAFDAEMRRLGAIRHANLLPPLAYHYRSDEKLIVYEYIPKGSLLYVLHGDRGMDYAALDWPVRLKVAAAVARGAAFLHTALAATHKVPHGNLNV